MKFNQINKEELDILGFTKLGKIEFDLANFLKNSLTKRKQQEINLFGENFLRDKEYYDLLRTCFEFSPEWVSLLESEWLNSVVDQTLDETAILHDIFCLFNIDKNQKLTRNKFHRDQPWLRQIRSSIIVFVFLSDIDELNATQVVPATHLFKNLPSLDFMEKNRITLTGEIGQVYVMDSTLIHKAPDKSFEFGKRILLNMKFQLSYMKRAIDLCRLYEKELPIASDLLKKRMGWFSRSADDNFDLINNDKWKSGQFSMKNTFIE